MKTKFLLALAALTVVISLTAADVALSATLLRRGEKAGHRIEARLADAEIRPGDSDPAETDPALTNLNRTDPAETDPALTNLNRADPAEAVAAETLRLTGMITSVSGTSLTILVEGQEFVVAINANTEIVICGIGAREGDSAVVSEAQATELTPGYWVRVRTEVVPGGYLAIIIVQMADSFDPFSEPSVRE